MMNSSLRLIIVATAMVAVLALVAGFAAENDQRNDSTTTETSVAAPAAPSEVVEADVPRVKEILARVGQPVELNVTLTTEDTLVIDAFGLDETIAAGIETPVQFTPVTPGRYELKLQNSGKSIGRLVVRPATGESGSGGTTPSPDSDSDAPEPEQDSPAVPGPSAA